MQNPELHAELSRVIESVIEKKASQRQLWREDHITLSWIEALQDSPELRRPAAGAIQVEFKAWKLSGRMEFTHGDVAVLARIRHPETSTCFEGCAFLEAKRSEPTAPFCYRHFNPAQYQRFSGLAAHRYVLYRREAFEEPVPNADDPNKHLVDVLTQMLELGGGGKCGPSREHS